MIADLDAAIRDVTRTDDWLDVTLVGTLLTATTAFVLPAILLAGYAVRILRDDEVPGFDDARALAVDGTHATGILLVYHAPVAVGVGVGGRLLGVAPLAGTFPLSAMVRPSFALDFLLDPTAALPLAALTLTVAVLTPACSYLATVALTRYVREDAVAAAFDADAVRATATDASTVRHWLSAAFVVFVASVVAAAVEVLPVVGPFVGAFVTFLGLATALSLWSRERSASRETPDATRHAVQA